MKINTDDLKAVYQDSVRQKKPRSFEDCPSPEKIVRLLRSGSSEREATKIIDHISQCGSCFSEFRFLLEVFRQEKDFIREVEKRLPDSDKPGPRRGSRRRFLGWRLGWRPLIPRLSWNAGLILAGFILASFFVAKSVIFRPSEKYRSGLLTEIALVEPKGEKVSMAGLVFKWKKVRDSKYYILELFDQALAPVWKSQEIGQGESAAVPKELTAALEVNRPYFWMVTAYLNNGEKISSRLERFALKE